ncbi:hypothetical protein DPEC_G00282160 [Dallia pectoralis]|uniref:Uncharacterized protein n=1 Tax=Dallia pectoralis TaxID=75939 RepID=A0ACC2FN49_DALPE|nr:hypothetical protein DPEC_G00282160 [Dallia pectoralis]
MTEEHKECFWPSCRNVTKAVKDRQKPEESCPKYSIRVLGWAEEKPQPSRFRVAEQVPEEQVPQIPQGKQRPRHREVEQRPWFQEAEQIPEERIQLVEQLQRFWEVTLLEEVKDILKLHGQMLNTLLKKDSMPVMDIPDGAVFPLANVEDVIAMNEKFSDPEFMSAVVAMVADIGGSSLEDATRRMMKFLMVPELQWQYNVTGGMGKLCFKDLRLFEVFYCALKSNAMTQNVNRKEVEMALGKWFTGARDRGGERAARAQREKGASTTQTS